MHTLHYGGGWPHNRHGGGSKTYNFELANDFHDYILEWDGSSTVALSRLLPRADVNTGFQKTQ
jgi:hypothetical protein